MQPARSRGRAFTIIEILIVVFIISVLAALVIPRVLSAMTESKEEAAKARGSQLYTLMVRYNQFHPDSAIPLSDGPVAAADLAKLVSVNYCTDDDLVNQVDSSKGWSIVSGRLVPSP
ncbi:MAG: prepilin-type N-terminal cleavage/methylation domain-containing protein [Phycisphaeraceae bacterium]|nr:prepilin-type N-terminal cleavage/methylation domain-containing protein [Phycisphaeraceae bacterium]